jgi:hypothetical protein
MQFWLRFFPVLACVLDCACRDKPSWRGHSCVTGDNQWSCGVVIARNRSLGALDHQRRDLHSIKLSYLMEDRATSSINLVSLFLHETHIKINHFDNFVPTT